MRWRGERGIMFASGGKMVEEIQTAIVAMEDPDLVEDPGNLAYWGQFFADRRFRELAVHEGPLGPPPKRNNTASHRHWWSASGWTLTSILEHIAAGNRPRLGFPRSLPPAARARHAPPANWLPRRMGSLSSSSSATSASRSSGSASSQSPRASGEALHLVKWVAETPMRSPPRTRSRGIVINELRVPSPPTGRFRLRQPKPETADWAVLVEDAFAIKMAMARSFNNVPPMPEPDALAWSRADWEHEEANRIRRHQEEAEREAAHRACWELAYQGAPLIVLDDDDVGSSFQP